MKVKRKTVAYGKNRNTTGLLSTMMSRVPAYTSRDVLSKEDKITKQYYYLIMNILLISGHSQLAPSLVDSPYYVEGN